jgi:hypothetical protein
MYQLKNQVYVLRLHVARWYFHRHSRCYFLPAPTLRPQVLSEQSDHQLFGMSRHDFWRTSLMMINTTIFLMQLNHETWKNNATSNDTEAARTRTHNRAHQKLICIRNRIQLQSTVCHTHWLTHSQVIF